MRKAASNDDNPRRQGEVPERSIGTVLKTVGRKPRGFESHPLRQTLVNSRVHRAGQYDQQPVLGSARVGSARSRHSQLPGCYLLHRPAHQPPADLGPSRVEGPPGGRSGVIRSRGTVRGGLHRPVSGIPPVLPPDRRPPNPWTNTLATAERSQPRAPTRPPVAPAPDSRAGRTATIPRRGQHAASVAVALDRFGRRP